jgi:hypothetical protein
MKPITITIYPATVFAVAGGFCAGLALVCAVAAGLEMPAVPAALVLLTMLRPLPAATDERRGACEPVADPHPAVLAFSRVPPHVRRSLDELVTRTLIEKYAA